MGLYRFCPNWATSTVRVCHSRKEHTESGSLTCVMLAKSACCMLEQSSLSTWLCRRRKAGPAQLHNCGCKNINSAMYFDFLDPEASILVTPVPPDRSPSTLSSFIEEPTAHASPTVFKQDFTWEPSYNAEILPQPSPPTLTLEIEALPSDEDDDNEPNVCSDTTYVQSQVHENRRPRKRGLSIMKTSSSAARNCNIVTD